MIAALALSYSSDSVGALHVDVYNFFLLASNVALKSLAL